MTTPGERLVRVETEMHDLKKSFDEHKTDTKAQFDEIKNKLDDLLVLRWKGAGAFWLAASLVGTGIVGLIVQFLHYVGIK